MNNIIIKVTGKNNRNFIKKLIRNNINIYNLKEINYKTIIIEIDYNDFLTINKTIYDIEIIDYKGKNKIKLIINKYKYLLISLVVGIILLMVLLNNIFEVNIIHTNLEIRNLVYNELLKHGIKKNTFKKSFDSLELIEKDIINNNKDKLEWLEIINVGCTYNVKVQERINNKNLDNTKIYNIVSKKDSIIKNIVGYSGEIVKDVNDYVNKDEVIISSNIMYNGTIKNISSASGVIYGETWYNVKVSYPLNYKEEILTGNNNKTLYFNIINKSIELNKKYNYKKINNNYLYKNRLLPIYISIQNQKEMKITNKKLSYEEAYEEALKLARKKITKKLKDKEHIIYEKCLKIYEKNSTIELEVFYSIYEDITKYVEVGE